MLALILKIKLGVINISGALKDLTGQKYEKLNVMKFIGRDTLGKSMWLCKCDCGNMTKIRGDSLTTGNSKSCGRCQINKYSIMGDIVVGITSIGQVFIFDTKNYSMVKKYTWSISTNGYVVTNLGYGEILTLHSLILGNKRGLFIDHISRNKLDNRIQNLRHVTHQQNTHNSGINKNNSTGYKGVYFDKSRKKYASEIMCSRKKYYLGRFDTAIEAAKAYNQKAIELFGEYAFLNEI